MGCKLEETIQRDLVAAMKSRDERRMAVLRMLKTSIQLASTEKGRGEIADGDIHVLVRRGIKQREEAAELYKTGGAPERAEEELAESRILAEYLPAQLGNEELERVISGVISSLGASGPKDIGRVMGAAMKETAGRADGKRVKEITAKLLA
ncbi:MAG: GatB/YqeY domain-containing protein [Synergistaceae bacterium]|jgi:uncharacterized protein YqeY|nr:GatB/YqeY domain-containing protein [Synergistaceae bacterium]